MEYERMNSEHTDLMPVQPQQTTMWDNLRYGDVDSCETPNPFRSDPAEEAQRRRIAKHKAWLESIRHECPSPYIHYRIGVYIRYFNQTKYPNYLDYHKQEFIDTVALCPNWQIVDFYVDEGQSAPNMESAREWCRLLDDCMGGRVDLIITQKISNVSKDPAEITFCSRMLAAQPTPVGIYFINEDLFTLASYYSDDLRERTYLPKDWTQLPDDTRIPEEFISSDVPLQNILKSVNTLNPASPLPLSDSDNAQDQ